MILGALNPEYRFSSVAKITPAWMDKHNYTALLLDIDNTLLPRNSLVIPETHIHWLQKMQKNGIMIVLASNNGGKRTATIESQMTEKGLCIPILTWAGKPFPRAYAGAIRLLEETFAKETVDLSPYSSWLLAAGDQLFTDGLGAHWFNLPVALLRPLSQNDFIGTKLMRILESFDIWYLKREGSFPEEEH